MCASNPVFHAFDQFEHMAVYHRHLPHWQQDGATYFVTLRLGDSIPRRVLLGWIEEDRIWLRANGIQGAITEPQWKKLYDALSESQRNEFEHIAKRRLHIELDQCHGSCLFRRPEVREVIVDALNHFHGKRWWVGDFVVMPNHVHGLFQPIGRVSGVDGAEHRPTLSSQDGAEHHPTLGSRDGAEHRPTGSYTLEKILGSVKGFSSVRLTKMKFKSGQLWQQENYDRLVRNRRELDVWRKYIHNNPAKASLRESEYHLHQCIWLDDNT